MSFLINPYAFGAGGGAFVPSDLGSALKAFFDFSDTAKITSSGGAVSAVVDAGSGGNDLAQGTAGAKPTTGSATLNSLNVLTFDGGDNLGRDGPACDLPASSSCTIVALVKFDSGTSGGVMWLADTGGSYSDAATIGRAGGSTGGWGASLSDATASAAIAADSDNTNWQLLTVTYTGAARVCRLNGATFASNGSAVSTLTPDKLYVGLALSLNRGAQIPLTGKIALLAALTGTGSTNYEKLEGWAAWKWNLVTQLDAGHPYKSAPP